MFNSDMSLGKLSARKTNRISGLKASEVQTLLKYNKKWLANQTGVKIKACTAPLF
jgi:hypothetical protein